MNRTALSIGAALICAGLAAPAAPAGVVVAQPPTGAPLLDLTPDQLARFNFGKERFMHDLTVDEGLGPIFNQTACGDCHANPTGATGTQKVLRGGETTKGGFDPLEEFGGSLWQLESISPECHEDPYPTANTFSDRVTNGMTGYGLVEAIPDADILFYQDNPPSGNVSGVAHMVETFEDGCTPCPPEDLHVGRFGWKAQMATILSFTADASLNEMGLTNRFLQQENDPNGINPPDLIDCDSVPDPEDSIAFGNGVDEEFIDVTTDFQRFMTAPPQTPKSGMAGEGHFVAAGCTDCHVPTFTTADDPGLEDVLRNKVIRPYGDFLLHNMGPTVIGSPTNGGADGIPQGAATAQEIKTPPLWGLLQRPSLWHDGRFESGTFEQRVLAAIKAHDEGFQISEGSASAAFFNDMLSTTEQDELIAFLKSLGHREFDQNLDNQVNIFDFHGLGAADSLKACYGGGPYGPDDACAIHDVDQDGDVDDDDVYVFVTVYSDLLSDCNGNGILDLIDILHGTLADADDNGIPDSCQPTCLADTNGDGMVSMVDFMDLLVDWGDCPALPAPCKSDLNLDHKVTTADFLQLLTLWGACQ